MRSGGAPTLFYAFPASFWGVFLFSVLVSCSALPSSHAKVFFFCICATDVSLGCFWNTGTLVTLVCFCNLLPMGFWVLFDSYQNTSSQMSFLIHFLGILNINSVVYFSIPNHVHMLCKGITGLVGKLDLWGRATLLGMLTFEYCVLFGSETDSSSPSTQCTCVVQWSYCFLLLGPMGHLCGGNSHCFDQIRWGQNAIYPIPLFAMHMYCAEVVLLLLSGEFTLLP